MERSLAAFRYSAYFLVLIKRVGLDVRSDGSRGILFILLGHEN